MLPVPDSTFGRYVILEQIAAGSRGTLFRAEDRSSGREVALKIYFLSAGEPVVRTYFARFFKDVELAASFNHPNVARIFDVGEVNGHPYVSAELCSGPSLVPLLGRSERPSFDRAVKLVAEVARALDLAHHRELFHRNVKPSNLIFHEGALKLTDFGACHLESLPQSAESSADELLYRAPEQLRGLPLDGRTDEFALGILFYQLVTGVYPFPGKPGSTQPGRERPSPPRWWAPSLPSELDPICARVLSRDPAERYPSCLAFAHALEHMLSRQSRKGQFIMPAEAPPSQETLPQLELNGVTALPQASIRREAAKSTRHVEPSTLGAFGALQQRRRALMSPSPEQIESFVAEEAGGAIQGILVEDPEDEDAAAADAADAEVEAGAEEHDGRDWKPSDEPMARLPHRSHRRWSVTDRPPPVDEEALSVAPTPEKAPAWIDGTRRERPAALGPGSKPGRKPPIAATPALAPGAFHPPIPEPVSVKPDPALETVRFSPESTAPIPGPSRERATRSPGGASKPFLQAGMQAPGEDPELAALIAANQQGAAPRSPAARATPFETPMDGAPARSPLRRLGFAILSAAIAAAVLHFLSPGGSSGPESSYPTGSERTSIQAPLPPGAPSVNGELPETGGVSSPLAPSMGGPQSGAAQVDPTGTRDGLQAVPGQSGGAEASVLVGTGAPPAQQPGAPTVTTTSPGAGSSTAAGMPPAAAPQTGPSMSTSTAPVAGTPTAIGTTTVAGTPTQTRAPTAAGTSSAAGKPTATASPAGTAPFALMAPTASNSSAPPGVAPQTGRATTSPQTPANTVPAPAPASSSSTHIPVTSFPQPPAAPPSASRGLVSTLSPPPNANATALATVTPRLPTPAPTSLSAVQATAVASSVAKVASRPPAPSTATAATPSPRPTTTNLATTNPATAAPASATAPGTHATARPSSPAVVPTRTAPADAPASSRANASASTSTAARPDPGEEAPPAARLELIHTPPSEQGRDTPMGIEVRATAPVSRVIVIWRSPGGPFRELSMQNWGNGTWRAKLPTQDGDRLEYYFEAIGADDRMTPFGSREKLFSVNLVDNQK